VLNPPYTFTPNVKAKFSFEGQEVDLDPEKGTVQVTNDPCQMLRFLNKFQEETNKGISERNPGDVKGIEEACLASSGGVGGVSPNVNPPPTPNPVTDPSATGNDLPTSGGEETRKSLSAPDPSTSGQISPQPPNPGESDGRRLAEQYYDPRNPKQDFDIASILNSQGTPPSDLDQALQKVIRNDPPEGKPHPNFGLDDRQGLDTIADPVIIFTGQYSLTVTDVEIPSRGFPLQLTRTYLSGSVYYGPWGYNWDHNYNGYLRELTDGGVAIWTGQLREEVYKVYASGGFESPVGVFRKLERQAATPLTGDRYVLSDREGMKRIFERPTGWPHPDRIPLLRIEDRHGNSHQLTYNSEGRLDRVEDHAGRRIQFIYGSCGLVEQITDHAGRVWRYLHDQEVEHLSAVITPVTPEYPEGLKTCYEYDRFRSHPALLHNLTRLIDPAGQVVVENYYGDDPDTDNFGRVVYQEFGGFQTDYSATRLQYVPRTPDAVNIPALQVEIVESRILHVYTFNYRGDLLDERFRLVKDGSYRLVAGISRYDEQGNLIEQREPNGLGFLMEYDHTNPDPRARGNLLRLSLSAPPTKPAPGRVVARYTYEPRYQQLKAVRDERGAVTTLIYDYEETATDRGDVIRIEHPAATLPDGSTQQSQEQFKYNSFGQLIEQRSGEGHLFGYQYYSTGAENGYLQRTIAGVGVENQSQEFGYDQYGNLNKVTEPSGAETEFEYNALGQMVHLRNPLVNGSRGEIVYRYGRDGRLKSQEIPRGTYQDGVIADPFIRNEVEYDVLGYVRSAIYGANTSQPRKWLIKRCAEGYPHEVIDPLGRVTQMEYDERNLLLRQTLFVGTTEARQIRLSYDRNGNQIKVTDPTGRQMEYQYDSWDRLTEVKYPGLESSRTRTRYIYGVQNQLDRMEVIGVPEPGVAPRLLDELSQKFDKRGRLVFRKQGDLSGTFWYDRDSCLIRIVDQRNHSISYQCDALGRIRNVSDPLGNQMTYTYDTQGNLTALDELEVVPNLAPPEAYHTEFQYDLRSRLTRVIDPLNNQTQSEYDDRDLLIAVTNPLGFRHEYEYDQDSQVVLARGFVGNPLVPVEHRWQRDLGGRLRLYTDPEGKQTQYDYTSEDQWAKITLPDGSNRQRVFDAAGQLIREIAPTGTTVEYVYGADGLPEKSHYTAAPGIVGISDLELERDGLGRPVRLVQGGSAIDLKYDLIGRLISETSGGTTASWVHDDLNGQADLTYPDGRIDQYQFDAIGRISSIQLQQPAAIPLTGSLLAPGSLLASYEYVGPSRIARRVQGNGCVSLYGYDGGRRLTSLEHRAANNSLLAEVQYIYDAAGRRRVIRAAPSPAVNALFEYDQLSRLIKASEGFTAPIPPTKASQLSADAYVLALGNPTAQRSYEFTLDKADTRRQSIVNEPVGITTDTYLSNDLHQITQLTRTAPGSTTISPSSYDSDGRRIGDSSFSYTYDAMGRLREVRDSTSAALLLTQEYDPLGRVSQRGFAGGAAERIRYLDARAIQEETTTGTALRQRCFGIHADELIAESEGEESWAHQDARLSLLAISDSAGTPQTRYQYSPFGFPSSWAADGVTPAASTEVQPIFGGHRSLRLNGLYDSRARVYDADIGCFLQRDPKGYGDSPNLYAYVSQNPVDLLDPTGEVAPLIAAVVIVGALAGAAYSVYDAYHHPERYEGWGVLRPFGNTVAGAVIGGASAVASEFALAAGGLSSAGVGVGGGTLTLTETFVAGGTASAISGFYWRQGFNGLFPEYVDPPSVGTVAFDYASGGTLGLGGRFIEAVGNPFSRAGQNTIRMTTAEAKARVRMWVNYAIGKTEKASGIGRHIADLRVARLHAGELQGVNVKLDSVVYRKPGGGQVVVINPEFDVVTDTARIEVKASGKLGKAAGLELPQAEYYVYAKPTKPTIYYVEPGRGYRNVVRDLLSAGVSEVRPLTPGLRGTAPFPLPFGGTSGLPYTQFSPFFLLPQSTPSGGSKSSVK
jgi:RHS repeat-associated protein